MKYTLAVRDGDQLLRRDEYEADHIPQKGEKLVLAGIGEPETYIVEDVYNLAFDQGKRSTVIVEVTKAKPPGIAVLQYYRRLANQ